MLKKLDNGKMVQINLSHNEEGKRKATIYGLEWKIPFQSEEHTEAYQIGLLYADGDNIEIITE